MKKKIIVLVIIILIVICIFSFIYIFNKPYYFITIDINPSIKINFNKNNLVKSIEGLNDDGKNVVKGIKSGNTFDNTLEEIIRNVIDNDYIEDDHLVLLMYSSKEVIDKDAIISRISQEFEGIDTEIMVIDNVTKEDEEYAKNNNITPAKAAYISDVSEKVEADKDLLINKPIDELKETENTGFYCDDGYKLKGSLCLKEIGKEAAKSGMVCEEGYYKYNDKCYLETRFEETDKLVCNSEFTLNGTTCSRTIVSNAIPVKYSCLKGEAKTRVEMGLTNSDAGDANDIMCVDLSKATHPVSPCELPANDPTERMSSGGKCYWHRAPVIESGCPGKIKVNGFCWDDASNVLICAGYRDEKQYKSKDEYCEHSIKYIDPVVTEYKCEEGFILKENKCEKIESEDAMHERVCPNNYTLFDNDKCINYNNTKKLIDGYYCEKENSVLEGTTCILFDAVEANHN